MTTHPCTLIADPDIKRLQECLLSFKQTQSGQFLNIGQGLSQALLEVPLHKRTRASRDWLETAIKEKAPGPVICADTDILFEPSLQLDPLVLFIQVSRIVPLVVFWPGKFENGVLSYALPKHRHYRVWRKPEAEIKGVDDVLS